MNTKRYLERINYSLQPKATISCLEELQQQHLKLVPFENANIYYGIPISLKWEDVYTKVIWENRGGYCYELNSLFYSLLKSIGFKVSIISGRVANGQNYGPEFDHMALLVKVKGKEYLVDVGFGDFALKPLLISSSETQNDGRCDYRITGNKIVDGINYLSVDKWNSNRGIFATEYIFTTQPRQLEEFLPMHHFHQTDSNSHFVHNLMCSIPTENGRISLVNNRLVKTIAGEKKMTLVEDDEMKEYLMKKYFNINFSIPDLSSHEDYLKRA